MEKPTHLIEFESMLLGRYSLVTRTKRRLDRSAYTLLSRLSGADSMSINQLSDTLGLEASTLRRQTTAMMNDGLIERIPDPDGGIARRFRVTDEGKRLLDSDRTDSVHDLDVIMADWTPEDVTTFATYLERFNTDIEKLTGRPWPRPPHTRPDAGQ